MNTRSPSLALAATALVLGSMSCGGPTTPTPPVVPPNAAPAIVSLAPATPRVEVGDAVALKAVVTDVETPVTQLTFQWVASASGAFTGAGAEVSWRPASDVATPAVATITLTVVERYTVALGGGRTETRENRTTSTTTVNVNNSLKETTELALSFLWDFANSSVSPETCVRNFTDSCRGKADELADIVKDRALYKILASSFEVERVELDQSRTRAVIWAPCRFTDLVLTGEASGSIISSSGICLLTAVYQPYRWWLCNSNWCDDVTAPCVPSFRGGSSMQRLVEGCS
ncbi:MAG TPA: hypothetical protein VK911_04160 [Vicinamibacterales bacterium]|nr:hypothetical protein [Vicinamibacterales bacterium]